MTEEEIQALWERQGVREAAAERALIGGVRMSLAEWNALDRLDRDAFIIAGERLLRAQARCIVDALHAAGALRPAAPSQDEELAAIRKNLDIAHAAACASAGVS